MEAGRTETLETRGRFPRPNPESQKPERGPHLPQEKNLDPLGSLRPGAPESETNHRKTADRLLETSAGKLYVAPVFSAC
eukprot:4264115-Pyramimonas_sp.AAC.1